VIGQVRRQLASRVDELRRRAGSFPGKSARHVDRDAPGDADDDNAIIMR
jgi:hypothetical protein